MIKAASFNQCRDGPRQLRLDTGLFGPIRSDIREYVAAASVYGILHFLLLALCMLRLRRSQPRSDEVQVRLGRLDPAFRFF